MVTPILKNKVFNMLLIFILHLFNILPELLKMYYMVMSNQSLELHWA